MKDSREPNAISAQPSADRAAEPSTFSSIDSIVDSITHSPKYRDIAPEAVARVVSEEYRKQPRDAEQRARSRLHMMTDAFIDRQGIKRLRECIAAGDLDGALNTHSSTRERAALQAEFIGLIRRVLPNGGLICDAACGLNPLLLGANGLRAVGLDIQLACVDAVNEWAMRQGWDVSARAADLTAVNELPECELTLLLKLLPVMEAQCRGGALALLNAVRSPLALISYPTRTLSGGRKGMAAHYTDAFMALLPQVEGGMRLIETIELPNEIFFLTGRP